MNIKEIEDKRHETNNLTPENPGKGENDDKSIISSDGDKTKEDINDASQPNNPNSDDEGLEVIVMTTAILASVSLLCYCIYRYRKNRNTYQFAPFQY